MAGSQPKMSTHFYHLHVQYGRMRVSCYRNIVKEKFSDALWLSSSKSKRYRNSLNRGLLFLFIYILPRTANIISASSFM
jgi:hypothetical protein